jgi:peptidoglycan/xylan/chitin deacetylase (PgdA/CDA1 family)
MRIKLVVHRYEVILLFLTLILTGSINIVSTTTEYVFPPYQRYPYCAALTFDDGPYPAYTEKLVKLLEDKNVRATFFLIGSHVKEYPDLTNLILSKGHEIANHTYGHPNLTMLTDKEVLSELNRTRKIIKDTAGIDTYLFRPPGGRINSRIVEVAKKNRYEVTLWTVLPRDHETYILKDVIVKRVIDGTKNCGIVCLHEGSQKTIDALNEIIDGLRAKGYRFVTVSQLLSEKERIELAAK